MIQRLSHSVIYSAKGVEFKQPPTHRFYRVEAVFKDNSGNWFSLTQPKDWKAS